MRVDASEVELASEVPDERLLAIDEALEKLDREDPSAAALVKLRFYAGMSISEAAEALGFSRTKCYEQWAYARAWSAHRGRKLGIVQGPSRNSCNFFRTNRPPTAHCLLEDMISGFSNDLKNATSQRDLLELIGTVPSDEWDRRLDEACSGDRELRDRVRALLRSHTEPGSFLDQPAVAVASPSPTLDLPLSPNAPARPSAATSSSRRSAKAAWAWSTWPSNGSRSAAKWP